MADRVGFQYQGNRLGYADKTVGARSNNNLASRQYRETGYDDEDRRGHYVPHQLRAQDAPVVVRNTPQRTDIGPTQPIPLADRRQPRQTNQVQT
jgi:hypothetical protein